MATRTLGTNTTTSLTAIQWATGGGGLLPADIAAISQGIRNDQVNGQPRLVGALSLSGILTIPNRGSLRVFPGDFIGVDSTGFPILLSAYAIANGPWTHT